jgi:hypothetical protein
LTLATVAATTLATGAAAWTIAFGAFLTVFLQLLFVGGQLFFSNGGSSLFCTWLTFFTRWAWCAFFTWLTSRTLFSGSRSGRSSIQRLAQFTNRAFFTIATWLAVFAWSARCTFFARGAWCAFFAWSTFFTSYGRGFFTDFAWLTWCAFFTRCTFLTRLALFVAATITVAALLTTVATFFVTGRALGGRWFFNHNRSNRLFLGREQADQ